MIAFFRTMTGRLLSVSLAVILVGTGLVVSGLIGDGALMLILALGMAIGSAAFVMGLYEPGASVILLALTTPPAFFLFVLSVIWSLSVGAHFAGYLLLAAGGAVAITTAVSLIPTIPVTTPARKSGAPVTWR